MAKLLFLLVWITTPKNKRKFKTAKEQAEWEVYKATLIYWSNLTTINEHGETTEVDYCKDSLDDTEFYEDNLNYLGVEVTSVSHVDQVIRSIIVPYKDREAQGIFNPPWMLWILNPFSCWQFLSSSLVFSQMNE